ncbi:MAG TPA: HAMP domain-containing sensor histidine kinase [Puia sp.]|nr:HAMP domain-containing sensor histidine kinase [Puia sp.]
MKLFFKNRQTEGRNHTPDTSGKADFIRQITHDIKGDFFGVSSVCLMLKLAIEKKDDPTAMLDHLSEACEEYKYKLNNFLEYTKFDAGLDDTIREPVNIRVLLNDAIGETDDRAMPKAIRIELAVSEELPKNIVGDEFRLKHIAENLLVNAINFSAPGSHVAVSAEKRGEYWVLTVSDSGVGMTQEQIDSLFRSSPAERMSLKNPTGLGLLVVRYLVEDVLEGKMMLTSEARTGTRVEIELPLAEAVPDAD